jgi:pathogen-inducible salicylic acid glucosyltransferase
VNQFLGLDTADHVLVTSFYDLEPQVSATMIQTKNDMFWHCIICKVLHNALILLGRGLLGVYLGSQDGRPNCAIAYLDKRLPDDVSYGIHLHTPMTQERRAWLDTNPTSSVLYVSFGSMATLGPDQMAEISEGLYNSGMPFLWVVRATETQKLPDKFADKAKSRGLIVPWCPQLEVLAHPSVGCFFTHCGWNSTAEALSAGVPMVAMPHWSDQTTNAKYIRDMWCVGIRICPDAKGMVRREEGQRCVREVIEGNRSDQGRLQVFEAPGRNATCGLKCRKFT